MLSKVELGPATRTGGHAAGRREQPRVSRRKLLLAGALGWGGLTLAELLRAEAQAGLGSSRKAIINIHLDGGPPQMDTIDPKPLAPVEIRGEFQPIATRIPGLTVCETMPRVAELAERFVFIRSLVEAAGRHDAFQCQSGFDEKSLSSLGGRPAQGCVLARLLGSPADEAPAFVDLMLGRPLVRNSARPGFLGPAYRAFRPDISRMFPRELEDGMKKELAAKGAEHAVQLKLNGGLSVERLQDRADLRSALDGLRREVDASGMMDALDRFHQQAAGILLSGRFAAAMDLDSEDPATLALYTPPGSSDTSPHTTSEGALATRKLLLARRLVEAGVRCVSVSFSDFDTHSSNFPRMRHLMPIVDHGLAALVTDLQQRGMLDDVSIVAWGEFGRTPKINGNGGRDHWPRVGMALLAGGGMRTGQVIGSTDRTASSATSRPVSYQDVFATLYHNLGIQASSTTLTDPTGRPQYLLDHGHVLDELT
ncbi:MAG: DUF1501 domain-containing protein [Pirellulaceae bacterium]|nr:DUF1501 domain-containing protein [Pirellulaceae bacterium]